MKTSKRGAFYEFLMHSKNYFFSNMATGALAFLSLPIITRILSTSDYGILQVFLGYQGIFIALLTLNCYITIGRYYYEKKEDFKEFFGSNLILVFTFLVMAFILFLLFREEFATFLRLPANTIIYIVPMVLVYVVGSWFEQLYMPQKKSKKIAIRNVLRAYGVFALSVVLMLLMESDKYLGQVYGTLLIGTIFFAYYYYDLKPYMTLSFQLKHIKYILHYAVPLLPYALSGVILAQFDRIMVNAYLGSSTAGLYSFAAIIGMMLTIVSSSMLQAWNPDYFEYMDTKNYKQLDSDAGKIFSIILFTALFLILFGGEIGMILGTKDYYAALPVIPIIVIGYVLNSAFAFYGWNVEYEKKNIYLSITVLAAGGINVVLNVFFIPVFGYFAAAYTTAISYFFMALFAWFTSKYILKIYCIPPKTLLKPAMTFLPFVAIYYMLVFSGLSFWILIGPKALILITGGFALLRSHLKNLRDGANAS